MDDDGNKQLSLEEFKTGLKEIEMEISDDEINGIFQKFDTDEDGNISVDEFLVGIRVSLADFLIFHALFYFGQKSSNYTYGEMFYASFKRRIIFKNYQSRYADA